MALVLKFDLVSESQELLGLTHRTSDSLELESDLRIYISAKCLGDVTADVDTTVS